MSDRFRSDWSGRHVRLKYQLVLVSVVFFCSMTLGIENISLPGLIKFSNQPNDRVVKFAIFSFFCFSLAAFWFRTVNERNSVVLDTFLHEQHISTIATEVKSTDMFVRKRRKVLEELKLGFERHSINLDSSIDTVELDRDVLVVARLSSEIDIREKILRDTIEALEGSDTFVALNAKRTELGLLSSDYILGLRGYLEKFEGIRVQNSYLLSTLRDATNFFYIRMEALSLIKTQISLIDEFFLSNKGFALSLSDDQKTLQGANASFKFEVNALSVYFPLGVSIIIVFLAFLVRFG